MATQTREKQEPTEVRVPVQIASDIHKRLRATADADGYKVGKLATRLIRDGLDRMASHPEALTSAASA